VTATPASPAASQQAAVDAALLVLKSMGLSLDDLTALVGDRLNHAFGAGRVDGCQRPRDAGRLSPRSVNTIVGEIGRIHDAETADRDRHLGVLCPHDLRHTFGYQFGGQRPQPR